MENNISTRHHTIPQFYLNSFAVKVKNGYSINIYNKDRLHSFSNLVEKIGYIKDFNNIQIEGIKTDIFEKLHNEIYEKNFSKKYFEIIRKIEKYNQIENNCYNCMSIDFYKSEDSCCLNFEDKKYISYLLAYFIYRGRKLRKAAEEFREKIKLIQSDLYRAKGYENKEEINNKIEKQIGTKEDIKIEQLISLFKGKDLNDLAKILYNHQWIIAYNNTEKLLYTSDNGHALDTAIENERSVGYDTYGNIIMFPINSRICILMYDQKMFQKRIVDMSFINLNILQVKSINHEIVFDGINEIYSKDGDWEDLREYYQKNKIPKGHKPYGVY